MACSLFAGECASANAHLCTLPGTSTFFAKGDDRARSGRRLCDPQRNQPEVGYPDGFVAACDSQQEAGMVV